MPLSSQREGPTWRPFSRRKKGPRQCEPQQLGLTPLGPFSGPENGPHFGAAAETRSRSAAVTRTLEIRRPFATEMQYATCLGVNTASHHIRIRPTASSRAHLLCCRLLPLTPSSCQRQREKDTEHARESRESERERDTGREAAARKGSSERETDIAHQTRRDMHPPEVRRSAGRRHDVAQTDA